MAGKQTQSPGLLRKLYTLSPEKVGKKIKSVFASGPPTHATPVTETFLRSSEYSEMMSKHLPYDGVYDLHEAQNETANFRYRHFDCRDRLGIFRWRGIQQHLEELLPILTDPQKKIVDFGGAASSVGFNSIIVDQLPEDAFGNPVRYHGLSEIQGEVDVIFSSHTLEHIPDLDGVLKEITDKLKPGGLLILHIPSFSCERWRPGIHTNAKYNDHVWAFGLEQSSPIPNLKGYCDIGMKVADYLQIKQAEYCGDDSIYLVAQKEG
ncbi:MAG: class I SAM-dependent methyltransferase [Candidatus Omnitrophica bacterium]|nr:class I SAM-dependent methyltransferase [Candidatus Omnitrophota bacterium]